MNWKFWKKDDKELGDEAKAKMKKGHNFLVEVSDPIANTTREVMTFYCKKERDDDGIPWLVNESVKFREVFPLDNNEKLPYSMEEIKKKIAYWEKYKPKENENELNKESELFKWRKLEKSLKYKDSSYMKITKKGIPKIEYVRFKGTFVPLKRSIEFKTIHTPSEPMLKNVLRAVSEKKQKYMEKIDKFDRVMRLLFWVIIILAVCVNGWWSVQNYKWADDSNYAKMQQRIDNAPLYCAEMYGQAGENFLTASKHTVNITGTLRSLLKPQIEKQIAIANVE